MEVKPDVDVVEAKELIEKNLGSESFVLLDVRTPDQYNAAHIEGSIHIELKDLEGNLHKLNPQPYYLIYCRSGRRSDTAANILRMKGFKRVSNMLGGILAWTAKSFITASRK